MQFTSEKSCGQRSALRCRSEVRPLCRVRLSYTRISGKGECLIQSLAEYMQARSSGLSNCVEPWGQAGHRFTAFSWSGSRHGSKAGYSSGVAGVDTRRATPPDPRPPRWGLAGCCQLDPSHPTIVTCAVGREGRHAPRPNDVGGQPRFPGARKGVTLPLLVISGLATGPPAGVGDGLRFLSPR